MLGLRLSAPAVRRRSYSSTSFNTTVAGLPRRVTSWGPTGQGGVHQLHWKQFLASLQGSRTSIAIVLFSWLDGIKLAVRAERPVLDEVKVMFGWNPFLRPTGSPARLFMGAVFRRGVVPFSTASSAGPRSGEAGIDSDHPHHAPKCLLLEGGHLRSGEGSVRERPSPISCAIEGAGLFGHGHNCCAGSRSRRARSPAGRSAPRRLLGCEANKHFVASPASEADPPDHHHRDGLFPTSAALIRVEARPPRSRPAIHRHQRSFCVTASPLTDRLRPLQGFVLGRQEVRLRRRGLRRRPLASEASRPGGGLHGRFQALSSPYGEERLPGPSRISLGAGRGR